MSVATRVTVRGETYTMVRRERSGRHGYAWIILRDEHGDEWRALVRSTRQAPTVNARLVRS